MSQNTTGTQPRLRFLSSPLRTARRSAVVASVAALALTLPISSATAANPVGGSLSATMTAGALAVSAPSGLTMSAFSDSLSPATYETRLKYWMNKARQRHGARGIGVRPCVDGFAEDWTRWLVANKAFQHQELGPIMRQCSLTGAAEILALGAVSPYRMVQMWMGSPGHRQILLSRSYAFVGISATKAASGSWTGAIEFGHH